MTGIFPTLGEISACPWYADSIPYAVEIKIVLSPGEWIAYKRTPGYRELTAALERSRKENQDRNNGNDALQLITETAPLPESQTHRGFLERVLAQVCTLLRRRRC